MIVFLYKYIFLFIYCRPERGYVQGINGMLYAVDRSWFRPLTPFLSCTRLTGQKLVFRMPDDDHCDARLSVVGENEPDEDDLSKYIADVIAQVEEEEVEECIDSESETDDGIILF